MDEKYYKLQEIEINRFDLDAPVEIEKGVLLLDKTSKNVFLQLKLNLLKTDTSRFSSVSVNIDCMDDAMEIIEALSPYTFTYRDIFLNKSKAFGEDNPILLDQRVRRVKVGINRVVFTDATTWQPTAQEFTPPKQELINSLEPELVEQFQRDIRLLSPAERESYIFIPKQLDGYWLCTCGRPNLNDTDICSRCSLSKKPAIYISVDTLQKKLDEYKEIVRLEEEKARLASERAKLQALLKAQLEVEQVRLLEIAEAKKRERKIARQLDEEKDRLIRRRVFGFITIFIIVLTVLYRGLILPAENYSQASNLLANKEYDKAILVFESLGDYKDSAILLKESKYEKAIGLLAEKNFVDAIQLFTLLGDYKDSSNLLLETNYQLAAVHLREGDYTNAGTILTSLTGYKDSANLLLETNYELGLVEYKNGNFEIAKTLFGVDSGYKDAGDYLQKIEILLSLQGKWHSDSFKFDKNTTIFPGDVILYKWKYMICNGTSGGVHKVWFFSENDMEESGLEIRYSDGEDRNTLFFDFSKQELTEHVHDSYLGDYVLTYKKINNGSACSYAPTSSSSSSSQCQTLRDNLELALILSGGYETDLTLLYRKALRDENCGN